MKLPKKIIKALVLIALSAFIFGFIRRVSLGTSYLEILLSEVNRYNWFDLIINDIYSVIADIIGSSQASLFTYKFLWGISTAIFIGGISFAIAIGYFWLQDKTAEPSNK